MTSHQLLVGSSARNVMSDNQISHLMDFEQDSLLVKQALHPPSSASVENQTIINEILNESLAIDSNFDPIDLDILMNDEIKSSVPDVIPQMMLNNPPIMNGTVHFTDCKSFVEEGLAVPAKGQWCSFALQLRKVTNQFLRKHIRSVRPKATPPKEYFSPSLKEEDMDLFGYSPMTDQLILVRCNHCTKTVKASRFNTHLGHCLKTAEPVEAKVAVEEKVNGKRKTAPVSELKKIKDEPLTTEVANNGTSKTSATPKTTIIIPTSSTTSTGESPTKKKKTSKSSKKDKEEKKKHKTEKKSKKDKKSKKSKTSTTTTTTTATSSMLTAPVQVELAKDIPVAITVPETLPTIDIQSSKQTKQAKKTKTEPSHNAPTTGFIPLAGGNIIFHNNVFMNNIQLNQALNHNLMPTEQQTSSTINRSASPSTTTTTTSSSANSDGKMNSPYTVTVPIQIIPQQPPFTATQSVPSTTNPPSPNPATPTTTPTSATSANPQSPKLKKKVKKIKKDLPGTPQFTQPHLQIQFQQYQQSLQRQFVNQPFTIQQLPNGVQQIYIHGLPQQILPGQPIQLSQQPITIQYQPLSPEQLQQIQQMTHGQVPVATTTPTTPGQTPTTPQLVSVPNPVATAMPRQAFAAIPVTATQQRRPIEIHSFPNGPTAQVYHITANGLVPQAGNKGHYFPPNVNVAVQPTSIVDTAKELIKTKSPVIAPKTIVAPPGVQIPGSKQEWFRLSKTASIIQAAQSQPPSPTAPTRATPQASPPTNVNTSSS